MAGDSRSSRVGFSARPPAPAWPTLHPGFARPLSPPRSSPKAPPILPPWLGAPPTSPRPEAPPTHLQPSSCFFHLRFHSGKPSGPKGDCWKTAQRGSWSGPWEGELQENRHQGVHGRSRRRCLAAPGTDWISAPALCVPSAARLSPVSWRDFWGPGKEEQVWRGLQPRLPQTFTRPLTHAHGAGAGKGAGIGELEGIVGGRDFSSEPTVVPNVNRKMYEEENVPAVRLKRKDPKRGKKHIHTRRSCGGLSRFQGDSQADSGNREETPLQPSAALSSKPKKAGS